MFVLNRIQSCALFAVLICICAYIKNVICNQATKITNNAILLLVMASSISHKIN